jgi:hypothetical protein
MVYGGLLNDLIRHGNPLGLCSIQFRTSLFLLDALVADGS